MRAEEGAGWIVIAVALAVLVSFVVTLAVDWRLGAVLLLCVVASLVVLDAAVGEAS